MAEARPKKRGSVNSDRGNQEVDVKTSSYDACALVSGVREARGTARKLMLLLMHHAPFEHCEPVRSCEVRHSAASVCCVFRIQGTSECKVACDDALSFLKNNEDALISVLFIKRAVRKGDKWSGDSKFLIVAVM
jgi:hypothetical protein